MTLDIVTHLKKRKLRFFIQWAIGPLGAQSVQVLTKRGTAALTIPPPLF